MKPTATPLLETKLLQGFGVSDALVGDLFEQYRAGRSRTWYWRQVLAAIVTEAARDAYAHKIVAARAMAIGWLVLLLFFSFGDSLTQTTGTWMWNWTLEHGYDGLRRWWSQQGVFIPTTVLGFFTSGWFVGRLHRSLPAAAILAYAASVLAVLTSADAVLAWQNRPTAVPHSLFYVIWSTLPFVWRVGIALVPIIVIIGGLVGALATDHPTSNRDTA